MKGLGWALGIALALLSASASWAQTDVISEINVQGNRRIPAETVKARIFTHPGDIYDPAALERDFNSLWNTGYFEDIRFTREETPKGWRLIIQVKEKPTIREINYVGLSSVSTSDVLDRFKEAKVGIVGGESVRPDESQESGSDDQRPAGGTRAPVFHDPDRSAADSAGRDRDHVCDQRRSQGQGRQDQVRGQQERQYANPALCHEELAAHRHPALRSSWKTSLPEPTTPPSWTKIPNGSATNTRIVAISRVIANEPKTQIHDTGHTGSHSRCCRAGPGKAVDITMPIEEGDRYTLGGITFKNNKAVQNVKALRAIFPIKDGDIFSKEKVAKGHREPAQGLWRTGLHQLHFGSRHPVRRR